MKPGEQFTCPACGRTAFAKLEKILDGWDVKGEHLVCSFCGADAGAPDAPESEDSTSVSAGRKALDALFGNEESVEKKTSILDMDTPPGTPFLPGLRALHRERLRRDLHAQALRGAADERLPGLRKAPGPVPLFLEIHFGFQVITYQIYALFPPPRHVRR